MATSNQLHFVTADNRILGPYSLKPCSSFRLNRQHCTNHYDIDTSEMVQLFENRLIRPNYKYTVTPITNVNITSRTKYKIFESSSYSNCNCSLPRHRMNSIWKFQLLSNSKQYNNYLYLGNIIEDYHFIHTAIIWIQISATFIIFIHDTNTYFTLNNLLSFSFLLLILSIIYYFIAKACHLYGLFDNKIHTNNPIISSTQWTINGTSLPTIRSWISQAVIESINKYSEKRIKTIHIFSFCVWIIFLIICPSTALRFCVVITSSNFEFLWVLPKHYVLQQDITWFIINKFLQKRSKFTQLTQYQIKAVITHILNAIIISQILHLYPQQSDTRKLQKLRAKHFECILRCLLHEKSICNHVNIFRNKHLNICKSHYYNLIKPSVMLPGKWHFLFWNDSIAVMFLIIVAMFRWYFIYDSDDYWFYIYAIDLLCNIVGGICVLFLLWYQLYHHWYDVDIITEKIFFWIDPELMSNMSPYLQPVFQYITVIQNLFLKSFEFYMLHERKCEIIGECLVELNVSGDIICTIMEFIGIDELEKCVMIQSEDEIETYNCSKMHDNVNKSIKNMCLLFEKYKK
eukprot:435704_1